MKTKLDIYLDAHQLAARTLGEKQTLEIDSAILSFAQEQNHVGADFDQFKRDFHIQRSVMLKLKSQQAPSEPRPVKAKARK